MTKVTILCHSISRAIYFKNCGTQAYSIFVVKEARKDIETYFTSYLSYRNELTHRKGFVTIQATPHRNVWVGSWSYFKKYNNIPSLHIHV